MIYAGIVTFGPELLRLRENLGAIHPQVDAVVIWDNGSRNIEDVRELAAAFKGTTLLESANNVGIAAALNRLAEAAVAAGASWLVTLDQDSVSPPRMVEHLLEAATTEAAAIVTPHIIDRNKGSLVSAGLEGLPATEHYRQPARRGAITSGSLVRLSAWNEVGGFDERLFIDYVDYDFNQRILDSGHSIIRSNRTHLLHEVGRAKATWLRIPRKDLSGRWKLERFYSFGHSPFRCYYKARNRVMFTRKYGRKLGLTHEGAWQLPQQIALTVLFEDQRGAKLRAFLKGIRDGMRERID